MKKYKNILSQLKGEFTIKDLNKIKCIDLPFSKFWWEYYYYSGLIDGRIYKEPIEDIACYLLPKDYKESIKRIHIPFYLERKKFDIWLLKYVKEYFNGKITTNIDQWEKSDLITFYPLFKFLDILREKAKQNVLFAEFLENPNIEEIEKNIKNFLNKFKGNYTEKFLNKEINKFMPYVWRYSNNKSCIRNLQVNYTTIYFYENKNYKLEKEPFDLDKKEFNFWIINQIKSYYKKNLYIRKEEIYIQFFLAFYRRAKNELIEKHLLTILKNFKKKYTIKFLIKITYKYHPKFIYPSPFSFQLENEPLNLNFKEFNIWLIKQIKNFLNNRYKPEFINDIYYQIFLSLRQKKINDYINSKLEIKKLKIKKKFNKTLSLLEIKNYNEFFRQINSDKIIQFINIDNKNEWLIRRTIYNQKQQIEKIKKKHKVLLNWTKKNEEIIQKIYFEKEYKKDFEKELNKI